MITVYIDGGGGSNGTDPKYGFYVEETGESCVKKYGGQITDNDKIPEYLALKLAFGWLLSEGRQSEKIVMRSDLESLVKQVNHEADINNDEIRDIIREIWPMRQEFKDFKLEWVEREKNLAGKMLGS